MQDETIRAPEGSRWINNIAEVLLTQQGLTETLGPELYLEADRRLNELKNMSGHIII